MTYIKELSKFEGQEVELKGWNAQKRDSKSIVFMTMRDGTGFVQCVIDLNVVGESSFEAAKRLPQESSLSLKGKVVKDERQLRNIDQLFLCLWLNRFGRTKGDYLIVYLIHSYPSF